MSSAKNVRIWHRVIKKGVEALDNACRRADVHQSNVCGSSARLVNLYSSYVCLRLYFLFCLFAAVSI